MPKKYYIINMIIKKITLILSLSLFLKNVSRTPRVIKPGTNWKWEKLLVTKMTNIIPIYPSGLSYLPSGYFPYPVGPSGD